MIRSLQAGRALAALAVVVYHTTAATKAFTVGMPEWLQGLCSHGYLGVDFFFVLSGFIIAHTRNHHPSVDDYARSRLIRVFIPYWPIGVAMAAAYVLFPGLSAGHRDWSWLATLTLLPTTGEPALNVAWTLQFELLFYAVFGVAMALGRPLPGILLWGAIVAFANVVFCPLSAALSPFLSAIILEFMIGVIAAFAVPTDRLKGAAWFGLATLGIYIALGTLESQRLVFGLAMGFLVIAVARAEQAGRVRVPAWLVFLGGASYSIYLVHNPVISVAARLFDHWRATFVVAALAGTAAGILYHVAFEKPAMRLLGRRRQRPVPAPVLAAPAPSEAQG